MTSRYTRGVVTIYKTSNAEHLQENLGALGWTMEAEDIERVRREFPGRQNASDFPLDYAADIEP